MHLLRALSIAMVISFIWILLLQIIAGPMVWFSIFAVLVLSTLAVLGCLKRYFWLKSLTPDSPLHSILMNKQTWLVFSIICGIVSFLLAVTFVFLRSHYLLPWSLDHDKSALFFSFVSYILEK
uniref:Uncharacterized protein n=1 Tax=Tetranychus urticae TaxID=32264 RepID=T1KMQ4_TETUR